MLIKVLTSGLQIYNFEFFNNAFTKDSCLSRCLRQGYKIYNFEEVIYLQEHIACKGPDKKLKLL